jgi:hypothetical protein
MPDDKTIDFVVAFVSIGMLILGLGSVALGWVVKIYDRIMSRGIAQTGQTAQTDQQTDQVSEADQWLDRLELDRTKTAVIELLVYSGWEVGQIRNVIKGDNGAIGGEIDAARRRMGIVDAPRELRVRDAKGERIIPMEARDA